MRKYINKITPLIIVVPLMIAAYLAFPVYDDGYMMLFLREPGTSFNLSNRDRPIAGAIHGALVNIAGGHKIVYVLLNGLLWLLFAAETWLLFRQIFPSLRRYATLAACLTLAPVVVETQISSIVTDGAVNLFTILSYAAILLCLAPSRTGKRTEMSLLGLAFGIAAFASFASEYAVATNLVGVVLLTGFGLAEKKPSRRRSFLRRSAILLSVTVAAYFIFVRTADLTVRPDVNPNSVVVNSATRLTAAALNAATGVWYSVIGAYASILGRITLSWSSKSNVVGPLLGLLIAILLWLGTTCRHAWFSAEARLSRTAANPALAIRLANRLEEINMQQFKRAATLLVAIAVGLLPVALMGRPTMAVEYDSRFRVPILPVAVALTLFLLIKLVPRATISIPVIFLGLIIGQATWTTIYRNVQEIRTVDGLGAILAPYVEKAQEMTVAVVPFYRLQNELNAHVTSSWPPQLEKRFWMYNEVTARDRFGRRAACKTNLVVKEKVRPIERFGPVSQILWVELEPGKPPLIEPYCLTGYELK